MNFIFTLNLASGLRTPAEAGANIQQIYAKVDVGSSSELIDLMSKTDFQIYAKVDVGSSSELIDLMSKTDFILGREFFIRKKFDNTKWTEDRGDIIIAVPFIGKVKEYFE